MTNFKVFKRDHQTRARIGEVTLKHGKVTTPVFMPVGTHGAVRGISAPDLHATGSEIMLSNTYHLFVRPGIETIEKVGGLHFFNAWPRPILTDSGGFQVFSLAEQRKISEEGVVFKNPFNGDLISLTPEIVVDTQQRFGSDIMMVFDECPPPTATPQEVLSAVNRTTRWAARCRDAHTQKDLALFPIMQGGTDDELRLKSFKDLMDLEVGKDPWQGLAIGGLSVGEEKSLFVKSMYALRTHLPSDRPVYLMGVGTPRDLVLAVACGVDMFDCVLPSRNGRHGIVMTKHGRMNVLNARFTDDPLPLEPGCNCTSCAHYSRSFIRHLLIIEDALGGRLCTIHNVQYFLNLMTDIRAHIENGTFLNFAIDFLRNEKNVFLGSEKGYVGYPETFV